MTNPISSYREKNGLTKAAFGALVGVQKSAVLKWELGNGPSPEMARKIEEITSRQIKKEQLRPDIWLPEEVTR